MANGGGDAESLGPGSCGGLAPGIEGDFVGDEQTIFRNEPVASGDDLQRDGVLPEVLAKAADAAHELDVLIAGVMGVRGSSIAGELGFAPAKAVGISEVGECELIRGFVQFLAGAAGDDEEAVGEHVASGSRLAEELGGGDVMEGEDVGGDEVVFELVELVGAPGGVEDPRAFGGGG